MALKEKIPSPSEFVDKLKTQNTTTNTAQPNVEQTENIVGSNTNNQTQKFTPEEINKIESLQQELNQVTFQLGQLKITKIRLKQSENQLLSLLTKLENKEKELANELNKKYGKGTLDTKTGEFTPTE